MYNSISPISFQGNLIVTTIQRGEHVYKSFDTTEAQDKLICMVAKSLAAPDEVTVLSKKDAKFFHALMEFITNSKIRNIKNEKAIYYNGKDQVEFSDRNANLLGGVKVELNY